MPGQVMISTGGVVGVGGKDRTEGYPGVGNTPMW